MNAPISYCLISRATYGDASAMEKLRSRVAFNARFGPGEYFTCSHETPCPAPLPERLVLLGAELPPLQPLIRSLLNPQIS